MLLVNFRILYKCKELSSLSKFKSKASCSTATHQALALRFMIPGAELRLYDQPPNHTQPPPGECRAPTARCPSASLSGAPSAFTHLKAASLSQGPPLVLPMHPSSFRSGPGYHPSPISRNAPWPVGIRNDHRQPGLGLGDPGGGQQAASKW